MEEEVAVEAEQDNYLNMDVLETQEVATADVSPVEAEYEKWKDHGKCLALGQALHPAILNNIIWEEETPGKIAKFALHVAREEALHWVDERKEVYLLEKGEKYDKARQVRREIRKILKKEKSKENFGG